MENLKSIRWKQRFENFEKSFRLLEIYSSRPITNEIEKAGMIQFFEVSFELAWKVLKDYLESEGIISKSPRETIKKSFEIDIIDNGHIWIEALEDRNLTLHTYDEALAEKMVSDIINVYYPELKKLFELLKKEL